MTKCSLFIAEPPGMDIGGVMGFYEVLLPDHLPECFEFSIRPWDDREVFICVRVTRIEFTLIGEVNYTEKENARTAVFVEPVMEKSRATQEEWQKFSETAST